AAIENLNCFHARLQRLEAGCYSLLAPLAMAGGATSLRLCGPEAWYRNHKTPAMRRKQSRGSTAMKFRVLVNVVLLCLSGSMNLALAQPGGTLLVVNREGGSISFIDLETSIEMARLPVGSVIPHEVAV